MIKSPTHRKMQRSSAMVAAYIGVVFITALMGSQIRPVGASGRFSGVVEMPGVADDEDVCESAYSRELWQSNLLEVIMLTLNYRRQSAANRVLDFYKLNLQWPPATCKAIPSLCITPYLTEFAIFGLWPQYFPDSRVPAYDKNPSCTDATPVRPSAVISKLQASTKSQLTTQWPNLENYLSSSVNEQFWRYEWCRHGMCSAWPAQPNSYFNAALQLKSALESSGKSLRSLLAGVGFVPSATVTYRAGDIQIQLIKIYGKVPEISCNTVNSVLQLWEIRFCYGKKENLEPDVLTNCPTPFSNGCATYGGQSQIIFPPA